MDSGVDPTMTIAQFIDLLSTKTGAGPGLEILSGFPPKPLQLPSDVSAAPLSSLPLNNGDTLTVREGSAPAPAKPPVNPTAPSPVSDVTAGLIPGIAAGSAGGESAGSNTSGGSYQNQSLNEDEDADLAAAIAASLADVSNAAGTSAPAPSAVAEAAPQASRAAGSGPSYSHPAGHQTHSATIGPGGPAPASVSLPDGTCVVRRVIESDNSCLFNAVGYVMERSRSKARELRQVIADTVKGDPETFSEAFLGMETHKYSEWILQPDKWGGAIELYILATHFACQIAAYDIQTQRCDVYGQDAGYSDCVMLIYDGLHYDALAVAAFEGAPEELDVTIIPAGSPSLATIQEGAARSVAACHQARQFTDTANFTLRCGICQIGLKGEKEAVEHAKATGHQNFAEY